MRAPLTGNREMLNPYMGLKAFEESEAALLFGRQREAQELFWTVLAYPRVVMYGRSGVGKTSLVRAGVTPLLRREGYEVLPVRLIGGTMDSLAAPGNPLINAVLGSWGLATPASGREPLVDGYRQREQERLLKDDGTPEGRLLVFDQIEEIFSDAAMVEWRSDFFKQVWDLLDEDRSLRVLFVLREDYLAPFETAAGLAKERSDMRFHLEGLRRAAALSALVEPALQSGVSWESDAATDLVDQLGEGREFIEPDQLQIIGGLLWGETQATMESSISRSLLRRLGGGTGIVAEYLKTAIQRAADLTSVTPAELSARLERALVTPAGTRAVILRQTGPTALIPNEVIDQLLELRLLRQEWRRGSLWIELAHDLVASALLMLRRR